MCVCRNAAKCLGILSSKMSYVEINEGKASSQTVGIKRKVGMAHMALLLLLF